MDPLSGALSMLKLRTFVTAGFDAGGAWAVDFGDQAGRIKCYAVTSGGCYLSVEGVAGTVQLAAGDCFVLPSGRPFSLSSDAALPAVPAAEVFARPRIAGVVVHNGGGDVFLAGGRFEVEGRHAGLLLGTLPPIIHLRGDGEQAAWRWSLDRLQQEVRDARPGGMLMAQQLAQMMLVQALRLYLSERPDDGVGWFFALGDPKLADAIAAIHDAPARRWTIADLAAVAGMSRSIFAKRFRDQVGDTPIAYLIRWRMMLAAERLIATGESLARIASSLGYESDNAFNTAFRRVMGTSPRRYARAQGVARVWTDKPQQAPDGYD